jgi:hypothetical protein
MSGPSHSAVRDAPGSATRVRSSFISYGHTTNFNITSYFFRSLSASLKAHIPLLDSLMHSKAAGIPFASYRGVSNW